MKRPKSTAETLPKTEVDTRKKTKDFPFLEEEVFRDFPALSKAGITFDAIDKNYHRLEELDVIQRANEQPAKEPILPEELFIYRRILKTGLLHGYLNREGIVQTYLLFCLLPTKIRCGCRVEKGEINLGVF